MTMFFRVSVRRSPLYTIHVVRVAPFDLHLDRRVRDAEMMLQRIRSQNHSYPFKALGSVFICAVRSSRLTVERFGANSVTVNPAQQLSLKSPRTISGHRWRPSWKVRLVLIIGREEFYGETRCLRGGHLVIYFGVKRDTDEKPSSEKHSHCVTSLMW